MSEVVRTLSQDVLNTPVTFSQATGELGSIPEAFVASPYTVLTNREKDALINRPFYIRAVRFTTDPKTEQSYVIVYGVTEDDFMFIFTDGSTGVYSQLRTEVQARIDDNHPTPYEGILVANGLRVSEYDLNAENKPAKPGEKVTGRGATYYLG